MSEDREKALEIALRYVLEEVRGQGIDIDELTEAVSARLSVDRVPAELGAVAVNAIETAADGLHYPA